MKPLGIIVVLFGAILSVATEPERAAPAPAMESAKITVNVLGHVTRQNRVTLAEGATALDALAAAGGAGKYANLKQARILRKRDGKTETIDLDLEAILAGKATDVSLREGDTLVVDQQRITTAVPAAIEQYDDPLLDARLEMVLLRHSFTDHHPKIVEAKARIEALSKRAFEIPPSQYILGIQERIARAQTEDAELSRRYSEKHPKRVLTAEKLRFLREELERTQQAEEK